LAGTLGFGGGHDLSSCLL